MYLDHFGLREAPFRITPHTEFFFSGANRGATLEALIYAITHDEGIVKVSGEVGSGKTMLCRMLLEKLPANVATAYLADPSLSRDEIRRAIAEELQAPLPEHHGHALLRALQDCLLDIYAAGRQVVVMIDEAHAMLPETLEEIRLLSNLESNRHKLLHIVLFGQPELNQHLSAMSMRPLKERITHNFALGPLHHSDIGNYLMFRLRAAGYRGPDLFTPRALQLISRASLGLTRRINILADKALLSAFSEDRHQVDGKQVKAAIRDAQFNPMHSGNSRYRIWLGAAALIVATAGTAYVAGRYRAPAEPVAQAAENARAPTSSAATAPEARIAGASTALPVTSPTDKPPTFAERLATSEEWLKARPDSHYFIQLLSTDANSQRDVETFLENNTRALDAQQIRIYRSRLSGRDRLGVIYGDYPTIEAANAELPKIAKITPASSPYIRSFSKLR
jgi:type II secretory pathway predicted ATPase ExeA